MSVSSAWHTPDGHPMWQESMAFVFFDESTRAAGTAAFGTFVNRGSGLTWLGCLAAATDGVGGDAVVFQRSRNGLPLTDADRRPDRLGAGALHWEVVAPGHGVLVGADDGVDVRLEFRDLYPPTSWQEIDAGALDTLAAGHVECTARVAGEIALGDREVSVDGWGHRDHSWGPRVTDIVRNHRWVAGTCGPGLSFSAEALHLVDGTIATMGFVARGDEITRARDVENLVTFDHDGLTPRRFESRIGLETGEEVTIESEEMLVCLYNHREGLVAIDALAKVRCGASTGFADLNLIANPLGGSDRPSRLLGGTLEDGLSAVARRTMARP